MTTVGVTYRHKKYPQVQVKVTEIKANGTVWGYHVGSRCPFATSGASFEKTYVPL